MLLLVPNQSQDHQDRSSKNYPSFNTALDQAKKRQELPGLRGITERLTLFNVMGTTKPKINLAAL